MLWERLADLPVNAKGVTCQVVQQRLVVAQQESSTVAVRWMTTGRSPQAILMCAILQRMAADRVKDCWRLQTELARHAAACVLETECKVRA